MGSVGCLTCLLLVQDILQHDAEREQKAHEIHLSGTAKLISCSRVTSKCSKRGNLVLEQCCLSEERKRREEAEKRRLVASG